MARTATLLELRTQVRERANIENSTFIVDSELNTYINASIAWVYDLLVSAYGSDYFITSTDFTTVNNQDFYTWAETGITDFYKMMGVSIVPGTGEEIPLKKFMFRDRGRFNGATSWNRYGRTTLRYRVRGDGLWFNQKPSGGQTVRLYHVPYRAKLTSDTNTFDGINGWEELVVIDSSIKCYKKEESDSSDLEKERAIHVQRVEDMADDRDLAEPERVTDVTGYLDETTFGDYEF